MSQLSHAQLQQVAQTNNIRVPILSHKVVGDRVELHLLGGVRVNAPLKRPPVPLSFAQRLARASVIDLRQVACHLKISGRSKMNKLQLIESILSEINDASIEELLSSFNF